MLPTPSSLALPALFCRSLPAFFLADQQLRRRNRKEPARRLGPEVYPDVFGRGIAPRGIYPVLYFASRMNLRIFLSSTSYDLNEARQGILKLLSVVPADLVRMETFGSDESRPADYSLQKLRQCNLFVGVYAERYGTVDENIGKSITQLEYEEASRMLGEGKLIGLLAYMLDPSASWKIEYVDRDTANVSALLALKEEIKKRHTVTFFRDADELSLSVLRDVLRKIGIGPERGLRPRTPLPCPTPRVVAPLGMEHYTERDAHAFRGREQDVAALTGLVEKNPVTLLIGDSGIGKTSLVQAGVFPVLRSRGWALASARPLDDPDRSIPPVIWNQLMEGIPPEANLGALIELAATAHQGRNLLIVIDQFEDVITELGTPRTAGLLSALRRLYTSPVPNLRIVTCYRGDAEPKVGKCWQVVSGSASGLPRYYLGALTQHGATSALTELLFSTQPSEEGPESDALLSEVVQDVSFESKRSLALEIYPPFLQMVAVSLIEAAKQPGKVLNQNLYHSLGRARQIIGCYLANQLGLLGTHAKECRAILVSLATNRRRLRKTVDELSAETNIQAALAEDCLKNLTDLRLVRNINEAWEITHDFLAQKVFEELVQPDEREARLFRDLLTAKAAVFERTGELLTFREHLGIYAHRTRIACTQAEIELLFASFLAGMGPIYFFLQSVSPELSIAWAEHSLKSEDIDTQRNAYRFLIRMGKRFPLEELSKVFAEHKIQGELARLIEVFASREDIPHLLRLRNKKAELVREAAYTQIELLAEPSDREVLRRLGQARKASDIRQLCRMLTDKATASSLERYRSGLTARSTEEKAPAICALGRFGTETDADALLAILRSRSTRPTEREICAFALARWAQRNETSALLASLLRSRGRPSRGALAALENDRLGIDARILLRQYKRFPWETAAAVRRTVQKEDIDKLRRFIKRTPVDRPMRDIFVGLLKAGGPSEARFVLEFIASRQLEVYFWNVPVLADAMSGTVDSSVKPWLEEFTRSDEFWEYVGEERGEHPLPVKASENLYLFKRLVGTALPSICGRADWKLLQDLLFHDYWQIQAPAAERIAQLADTKDLDSLLDRIRGSAGDEPDPGLVYALSLLDQKFYGASFISKDNPLQPAAR